LLDEAVDALRTAVSTLTEGTPSFKSEKITIALSDEADTKANALVFKTAAVWKRGSDHVVVHVPSTKQIAQFKDEDAAKLFAVAVDAELPSLGISKWENVLRPKFNNGDLRPYAKYLMKGGDLSFEEWKKEQ
jgi:hypothetical protein